MSLAAVGDVDVRSPWHARVLFAAIIVFWTLMAAAVTPWQQSTVERGLALFNQGKYAEALEVLTQAITEDPANIRAWNGRGMVKRRLKDLDGAWDDLTKAIALSPRYVSAHNNRGLVRADRGDFTGAIADYDRAIEFNPKLSTPYNNRGVAKGKLGDYAGAVADYTRAIELAPKDAVPYANRAADRDKTGDVEGARQDVETALALNPTYPFALEMQKKLDSVEPRSWTLDKTASQRMADPCGPQGISATADPPLPPPPAAAAPDLRDLEATLASSINRLDQTQYMGAVSAAMQATRILTGPLTPAQEQKVFAAWAPLFDYPTDRGLAYLEQLNPLLVEFIALMRGVEAAEAGLEQAQYEAEMAAAYDHEMGTRAAMTTAMRFVAEIKHYKTRINDVAARVVALGDPPDPMKDKCDARTRTKRAMEFLKTLSAPKAADKSDGELPPADFLKTMPPSEWEYYRGKGYPYWLALPLRTTPARHHISVSGSVQNVTATVDTAGTTFSIGAGYEGQPSVSWSGRTFTFTKTDTRFSAWTCPAPGQTFDAQQHIVRGTLSADGRTVQTLTVDSVKRWCVEVCTHGPERINTGTGEHRHRPTGEDTAYQERRGETRREFVNLPLTKPQALLLGNMRGASLEYRVRGRAVREHVRALTPFTFVEKADDQSNELAVTITWSESMTGTAPAPDVVSPREQQIAIHTENIRLITEDLARFSDQLSRATDADSRTFYQYMITGKTADLQRERDAIATVQTGNFTRTMTAWDVMVQGQMVAQSREMAAKTAARPSIEARIDRLIDFLPQGERAEMQRWARGQMYGEGEFGLNAARVAQSLADQVRESNERQGRAANRDAAWNEDVISNLESAQTAATYTMYAAPFIASGGTVALGYGLAAGTVSGYQTGGHLGPEAAGTVSGTALAAVTTAARFWAPAIDYSLTFFEGYTAVDERGQPGGVSGALQNVAETFVKRKIIGTATKAVLGRQARLEAARKGARLDDWRDAQRRVAFQQERQSGKALVEQHNRLYNELRQAKGTGATPAQLQQLEARLMDATAAIKQSPHAKGYLKFSADAEQTAAYASTDRLHTARVLQDFKQDLQASGFDLTGMQFRPIRNAGNTTPGMDLDLALSTKLTRITVTDPRTQQVSRLPLYEANARMQEVFDRTYARLSGGRSARASWQMVTTSKHLEAYQDLTWLRLKPGTTAGPVDPLSALDPRYAADAARVTEIKADEVTRQSGMTRDNRNWEIYRGTSKDITTKVLPLVAERLKTNLTPAQRQQVLQRQEFYTRLSHAMDLANHDPVAAERALYQLTGHQGADLARMVSMGIASLGTFRRP